MFGWKQNMQKRLSIATWKTGKTVGIYTYQWYCTGLAATTYLNVYSAILCSQADSLCLCHMWFWMRTEVFYHAFLNIHQSGVLTVLFNCYMAVAICAWCHFCTLSVYFIQPCTMKTGNWLTSCCSVQANNITNRLNGCCFIKASRLGNGLTKCYFAQAAKICNNMLLAISMIGTSETMNLGMK